MKITKMKQNKNTSAVRVASAALAAFVFLFSLCVPSFAYTDTSTNGIDFTDQPLPIVSSSATPSQVISVGYSPCYWTSDSTPYVMATSTSDSSVYVFAVGSSYYAFDASNPEIAPSLFALFASASSFDTDDWARTAWSTINNVRYYYRYWTATGSYTCTCPKFSSIQDGISAALDWESTGGGSGGEPGHFLGSLQPGYVAYFDVSNLTNVSVRLSTTLYGGTHKYPGFSTSQAIGTSSSLPTGSFSLPISGTSSVNWQGSGQKNLIGQYSQFQYYYTVTAAGNTTYLVVVNPLSRNFSEASTAESASASNRNYNITVMIDQCRGYKTFSLTESISIGDAGWSASVDTNGSTTTGYYDPDTGAWTGTDDQTGDAVAFSDLPVGGGNSPASAKSVFDFLQEIADSIKGFFNGAIGAVGTLVAAGSDFIHSLSGLYAWLPAPVYSVLVSALILVITIGVIKVFI